MVCFSALKGDLRWNCEVSVVSFSLCEDAERFSFTSGFEEGRDRCPYDPAKGYTGLLVGMFPRDASVIYHTYSLLARSKPQGGMGSMSLLEKEGTKTIVDKSVSVQNPARL